MFLRLKQELSFIYLDNGISVYYGNSELNKLIVSQNNKSMYEFFEFIKEGRSKIEIEKYNMESEFKNEIVEYLLKNKYAVWEKTNTHKKSRTELFINTYPQTNFSEISEKIKKTKILIIGVGTAGSYILEILTKLGFSNFFIIDGDNVSFENVEAQFYSHKDVGKKKVEILKLRYSEVNIFTKSEYVVNYKELQGIILDNNFDFIINCADDFNIMINLLNDRKNNVFKSIILESGYAPLRHQTYKITTNREAHTLLEDILKIKSELGDKKNLITNSGSIFNAWLSSFSISKIIFDHILEFETSDFAEFDFFQNRYFLGNSYNKDCFDIFSSYVQENMKYTSKDIENEVINKDNIFQLTYSKEKTTGIENERYIQEFLKSKYDIKTLEKIEDVSLLLLKNININMKYDTERIDEFFIEFIKENFDFDIEKLNYIIKNRIVEHSNRNTYKQQIIKKNWRKVHNI